MAVDPHPFERLRFELEADLASRSSERRPSVVALADRLCQALQAPLAILGRIERRLQAFRLARLFGGETFGLGCGASQLSVGSGRRLALLLRCDASSASSCSACPAR
jgi:hypothetical protein